MLVEKKQLKTVNANAEIYDDSCISDAVEIQKILDKCAEITLPQLIKNKMKNTA